jgi:hypothetical protein
MLIIYIIIHVFFLLYFFEVMLQVLFVFILNPSKNDLVIKRGLLGVLLAFSQTYVKHDLRKNKIVVPFFANKLIFMS